MDSYQTSEAAQNFVSIIIEKFVSLIEPKLFHEYYDLLHRFVGRQVGKEK